MKKIFFILCALILFAGCLPRQTIRLDKLNIAMAKSEVVQELGQPYNVVASKGFPDGIIEIWEYRRYGFAPWDENDVAETYWLYFLNGKLKQWGRPGDWSKEADRIYELRLK